MTDLSRWIRVGPNADKLNYVFVTVDPQRDTPKVMHAYVSSFDKHIHGFTGTPEQIAKIAKEYGGWSLHQTTERHFLDQRQTL